jgi:hypothetical protein
MLPPQGFAKGGIASLNPMARGMAEAGRYGDTMLAHISPVEAQILRRYGGSGTINPTTGMPEFFLKKMFKKLGMAVKKFANTTIGKIVIGTALFMVAGPAAASMLGASAGGAAAAGISGFVSGAGTSLLAGGNLKDSLKAGAIGGITAGVSKGVMNRMGTPAAAAAETAKLPDIGTAPAADTGVRTFGLGEQAAPITRSAMGIESLPDFTVDMGPGAAPLSAQAAPFRTIGLQGDNVTPFTQAQFDRTIQSPTRPSTSSGIGFPRTTAAPGTLSSGTTVDLGALDRASPTLKTPGFTPRAEVAAQAPSSAATIGKTPGFFESIKNVASPAEGTTRMGSLKDAFLPGKGPSIEDVLKSRGLTIDTASALDISKAEILAKSMANNAIRQYAPLAATGLGIMALTGGFEQEEVAPPEGFEDFMSGISPGQRLLDQDPQRYGLSYGGVGTTASTPQYRPYSYTPPPRAAAKGGSMDKEFPRKTGPINGPGTGTSDDIPAMLSDGEFVFTAKAVRGMGDGSRRKGAQRMYALMRKLEGRKNG